MTAGRREPAGRVDSLWAYPLKGAAGVRVDELEVRPGTGALRDRSLAIARGDQAVPARTEWRPRSAFKQVARDPDMTQVRVTVLDTGAIELHHRVRSSGPSVRSDQTPEDQEVVLREWFGEPGLRLVHADAGALWDLPDTELSVINLASLRALEQVTGRELDVRRFRANVYISDVPAFAELSWVGRRVRIGDCEVEVLRPTARCRATSANPETGERDIELPSVLTRAFGHPNLGFYARVVEPGAARLRVDAPVVVGRSPDPVRLAAELRERREVVQPWPREADVVGTVREDGPDRQLVAPRPPRRAGGGRPACPGAPSQHGRRPDLARVQRLRSTGRPVPHHGTRAW